MVYNTQRYWVFGLCPSSGVFLNNNEKAQRFGNWICFRPQVREDTYYYYTLLLHLVKQAYSFDSVADFSFKCMLIYLILSVFLKKITDL
jgi:hypothetical protein